MYTAFKYGKKVYFLCNCKFGMNPVLRTELLTFSEVTEALRDVVM